MTDEQIIEALKCLTKDNASCDDRLHCYFMFKEPSCFNCYHEVAKNALDLVNRQKAEIEQLRHRDEKLLLKNYTFDKYYDEHITKAKSQAIKEFAERLKAIVTINNTDDGYLDYAVDYTCLMEDIDSLVKEMTEGEEMREKLIELIIQSVDGCARHWAKTIADYLLTNGVVVLPCNYSPHINTMKPSCRNCLYYDGRGRKCTLKAEKALKEQNNATT